MVSTNENASLEQVRSKIMESCFQKFGEDITWEICSRLMKEIVKAHLDNTTPCHPDNYRKFSLYKYENYFIWEIPTYLPTSNDELNSHSLCFQLLWWNIIQNSIRHVAGWKWLLRNMFCPFYNYFVCLVISSICSSTDFPTLTGAVPFTSWEQRPWLISYSSNAESLKLFMLGPCRQFPTSRVFTGTVDLSWLL